MQNDASYTQGCKEAGAREAHKAELRHNVQFVPLLLHTEVQKHIQAKY